MIRNYNKKILFLILVVSVSLFQNPSFALEQNDNSSSTNVQRFFLNPEEKIIGKHIASDFHIHAFNHNEGDEIKVANDGIRNIFKEKGRRKYLRHITRRAREGGFNCSFHSFSEHIGGYRNVNKLNMILKIDELRNDVHTSQSGFVDEARIDKILLKAKTKKRPAIKKTIWQDAPRGNLLFRVHSLEDLNKLEIWSGLSTNLQKQITNAFLDSHFMERECSFFSQGWEYTPDETENLIEGHQLILFADNPSFIFDEELLDTDFTHRDLYTAIKNATPKDFDIKNSILRRNKIRDALIVLNHPTSTFERQANPPKKFGFDLNNLQTIRNFTKHVLQKIYNLEVNTKHPNFPKTVSGTKERIVGLEFTRAGGKVGDKRAGFINDFAGEEDLYRTMLSLGYNITPMVNGDRHSFRKLNKNTGADNDPNTNLTVLGPIKPIENKEILGLIKNLDQGKKLSKIIKRHKFDPIASIINGQPLVQSFEGHTNLIVTGEDTAFSRIEDALSEEAFYQTVLKRRAYITYKGNLKLTTLATMNDGSSKHMGSRVKISDIQNIKILLNNRKAPEFIGGQTKQNECAADSYKLITVYSKLTDPVTEAFEADIDSWIAQEEVLPKSSRVCETEYNFTPNDEAKKSPFLYFKVIAKASTEIFEKITIPEELAETPIEQNGLTIAMTSAYLDDREFPVVTVKDIERNSRILD